MTITTVLVILGFISFVLATFGVSAPVNLIALGLAFVTGAMLLGAKVFGGLTTRAP